MKKICNRKNKMFDDVILMLEKYVIKKIKEIKTKTYSEIIIKSNECTCEGLHIIVDRYNTDKYCIYSLCV